MAESKSILHELYVFSEWKPEPEYLQKHDSILPENISALWRWFKFFGPKKSLIDSVTAHKEKQQKWHIALGDEGKVIAVLTDSILEIRTKRSEYATIAARTTVSRDAYAQWRKLVWSPDCSFLVLAYGNGIVSFFDLTASNLFNIPADCSRPGGLECTDNTHAVSDIIFMPLRVKDTKWNWEVLVVTFDGRLRGYVVSQTEGFKLRHSFRFPAGVAALAYCPPHDALYVAGVPRNTKDVSSPLSAGITAWRILNEEPFYKLSVVSDQLETQLNNERFNLYIPFITSKNMNFIVRMEVSSDSSKLVCIHCNGEVSVWRLPLLRLLHRWPLARQPAHHLRSPLQPHHPPHTTHTPARIKHNDPALFHPADVNWWTNEEIILSRFSGAVSVCGIEDMENILGKQPEFFQGTPQVTRAHEGAFMVLECESNVLPANKSTSDETMEVVKVEEDVDDSMLELTKELFKTVLFAITDMETFQPKPKKITVVSRVYRLLGVKSTTPTELFSRKIESGNYSEALSLAEQFGLDSDLVYQQQWRKNPVSTDAIDNYLSKVSKKIWAVHQCVDRLPETLPAANDLLRFGLHLTNERILDEINKERGDDKLKDPEDITLEDLNAYTSELLRCRHVMLFYKERLRLYESILKCEKSTYNKEEYDCLRSNSIVHSAVEIAKEGRIEALTCLWPHIRSVPMQLAVLDNLPEIINPLDFQHILPTTHPLQMFEHRPPVKVEPLEIERDWCRKQIFRSIWSSNWSEDTTPESESASEEFVDYAVWYERRARDIEARSGLASHALALVTLAAIGGGVKGLDNILFHLLTLSTLIYDINVEGVTLSDLEKMSPLETCKLLMKMTTPENFVADVKQFVVPFMKRFENLTQRAGACLCGIIDFVESVSIEDLSYILLLLQSPKEFELDVRTHIELAERCLFAHNGTDQLEMAVDLLNCILKETDGTISSSELVRRVSALERLVGGATRAAWRGVRVPLRDLRDMLGDARAAQRLLARLARTLSQREEKPTPQDWESLLKDILELQATLFDCVTKEQCYEIYSSALLASGEAASVRLAASALTCARAQPRPPPALPYLRSVQLVIDSSKEYFNSASSLTDPALELAKCCLSLIEDENEDIKKELDLISSLSLLNSFGLTILPIQVRLCEDRMLLIKECLTLNRNAYLASHKLLNLAKLLRIAGDDEITREGMVLQLVGEQALGAGGGGGAACAAAARRLAALRYAPAAPLLADAAKRAHAHADLNERRALLAAAAAHAAPADLEAVLCDRLNLEVENLQQTGSGLADQMKLATRRQSTDEEFADAVTTPVVEKKDLVPQKLPIFNYLIDTVRDKLNLSDTKDSSEEAIEHSVHCPEFYRCLYPEHSVCSAQYSYERFSMPAPAASLGRTLLAWYYTHSALLDNANMQLEADVLEKCGEELLYNDTPLSVSCLVRAAGGAERLALTHHTPTAASAALYATLLQCNSSELKDNVYLAQPKQMARSTLKQSNATEEQLATIRLCLEQLAGELDVKRMREFGVNVNGLLFGADPDYRREIIYRLARSTDEAQVRLACALARRHSLDEMDVWLTHAAHARADTRLLNLMPENTPDAHTRIKEALWEACGGAEHGELLAVLGLLQRVDDRPHIHGLTAQEHIKLLKKAKAASPDLDYKLLVSQPCVQELTAHLLHILRPENVGMVGKFLRTLPPAIKLPLSVNSLYTTWLTKHFFSVGANASNKKWMQQYRQCASYFNKLAKDDLLRFLNDTCFSSDAVKRVPAGTRNLMLMQAVDYCQQEQENDYKFSKNEQSWSQVGEEVTRWARFLDNYHSAAVQALRHASDIPDENGWTELEMSHGDVERATCALGELVVCGVRPAALASLLHCLHLNLAPHHLFQHRLAHYANDLQSIEILVGRVCQYHKEGVKFPEEVVSALVSRAEALQLPPHRQLGLLALSRRTRTPHLDHLAHSTAALLRNEWPDLEYAQQLTDDQLLSEEGRREVFSKFMSLSDSWQKKKALVDVLNCWPPTKEQDGRSLHCEYVHTLLNAAEQSEALVLIKLLLREPILDDEEVQCLCESAPEGGALCAVWLALLNHCDHTPRLVLSLLDRHKEWVRKQEIEDDLIKELLDNDMFIPLVPTVLYSHTINYIINKDATKDELNTYTVSWAIDQLKKANYIAEAGQLQLLHIGVPAPLRGFTQSVLYFKNILNQ
ncbi:PREDICTED: neuroblastoma-amplified sequence-like [Papilio xuthus]|uniref:Neuroblastoma-amplified sequence-like n=1 Tax=Papilio xuthus TaxID=66420 RepID=A0AAJ7EGT8_PAPXU|nr:PREDICTED: neuroblastoma-amplified sequence-like [Papilio xuthus]